LADHNGLTSSVSEFLQLRMDGVFVKSFTRDDQLMVGFRLPPEEKLMSFMASCKVQCVDALIECLTSRQIITALQKESARSILQDLLIPFIATVDNETLLKLPNACPDSPSEMEMACCSALLDLPHSTDASPILSPSTPIHDTSADAMAGPNFLVSVLPGCTTGQS